MIQHSNLGTCKLLGQAFYLLAAAHLHGYCYSPERLYQITTGFLSTAELSGFLVLQEKVTDVYVTHARQSFVPASLHGVKFLSMYDSVSIFLYRRVTLPVTCFRTRSMRA